jgi:hypothetical protein
MGMGFSVKSLSPRLDRKERRGQQVLRVWLIPLSQVAARMAGADVWKVAEHGRDCWHGNHRRSCFWPPVAVPRAPMKAIAAFGALAERLDALATERARPRWRRLAG